MSVILIIEDDWDLATGIRELLSDGDYEILIADSKREALVQLRNNSIDLCLLDIRLPDGSGYDLCRQMREFFDGGIIMLTACANTEQVVEGLKAGADDYVTKPFQIAELMARIETQLRRTGAVSEGRPGIILSGDLVIHTDQHQIWKNGEALDLSIREYLVCELLLDYRGKIVSREMILEKIWDMQSRFVEEGTLNVHISRIRKKLGSYRGMSYIETIKGIGYRWSVQVIQH